MPYQLEAAVAYEVFNVLPRASVKIVGAQHFGAAFEERFAEERTDEARASRY
jgi:cation transport regulator ChaB